MENNNTNTDYHKFVRLGDQKWEIAEITIGIIFFFFCLRYVFTIFYTGSFQVPPKKNHPHLKCQFPPKIPIWPKSLLYERSEKWLSPPSPSSPRRGEGCELWSPNLRRFFGKKYCPWLYLESQDPNMDSPWNKKIQEYIFRSYQHFKGYLRYKTILCHKVPLDV